MEKEKEREVVEKEEEVKEEEDITTTMQSSTAMQHSCTRAKGNFFSFPMNKEEDNKKSSMKRKRWRRMRRKRGRKEAEAERDEIRTGMQSSIAMEQSCSCGPRQLFLYTELGGEGRRRR